MVFTLSASPTSIPADGQSLITVAITPDPPTVMRVVGELFGTAQSAEVQITVDAPPIGVVTDVGAWGANTILLECPDGGTIIGPNADGSFTFQP